MFRRFAEHLHQKLSFAFRKVIFGVFEKYYDNCPVRASFQQSIGKIRELHHPRIDDISSIDVIKKIDHKAAGTRLYSLLLHVGWS